MAFKIIFVVAAMIACVQARPGGPAAYSISAPAGDAHSVGNTHEHTVKGPGGASSQSDYTSQFQTAHAHSHVSRSSTSNDHVLSPAHGLAHAAVPITAQHGYASYGHSAPALSYAAAAPVYAHGYAGYGHDYATAPAYYGHGHAQQAISHSYVAAQPAPVAAYPEYAAHHIAPAYPAYQALHAPIVKAVAAPALVHTDVHGHGVHYGY